MVPLHRDSAKFYLKRITSEYCEDSCLQHPSLAGVLDLLQITEGSYCEVMEYITRVDLVILVLRAGRLEIFLENVFSRLSPLRRSFKYTFL